MIVTIVLINLYQYIRNFWTKKILLWYGYLRNFVIYIFFHYFSLFSQKNRGFLPFLIRLFQITRLSTRSAADITLVFIMYIHDVTSLFASSNKKVSQRWKFWREKHFCVEVNVLLRVQSTGKVLLCSKKILIKLLVAKLSLC